MSDGLEALRTKREALREELSKKADYAAQIEMLQEKLAKLDKKLGVTKK
jgi:Tfp pilus assembly protein PilO